MMDILQSAKADEYAECVKDVLRKNDLPEALFGRVEGKGYTTISIGGNVVMRIRFGKKASYVSFPPRARALLPEAIVSSISADRYLRVTIDSADPAFIVGVSQAIVDDIPCGFDCCSRYLECSAEMRCVNPHPALRVECGYRKKLAKGVSYYG